jgi:hypothetical protein
MQTLFDVGNLLQEISDPSVVYIVLSIKQHNNNITYTLTWIYQDEQNNSYMNFYEDIIRKTTRKLI